MTGIILQEDTSSEKVNAADVLELFEIFSENNWFKNPGASLVYKNFILMLAEMSAEQKELIIELTKKYLWISPGEYYSIISEVLDSIETTKLKGISRIFFYRIKSKLDSEQSKSGDVVFYNLKAFHLLISKFKNVEYELIDSFEKFSQITFTKDDLLFLVDDFIGSGDSLTTTINELSSNVSLSKSQINAIALVVMNSTKNNFDAEGIHIYTKHTISKGISETFDHVTAKAKIATMLEIEKLIPRVRKFSLGYKQSEALLSLIRTPNNTFPIFWKSHKKKGKPFAPPFPRDYGK